MTINVFGGGDSSGPAFPLQRSVRLRSSNSAYFNRTLTTPTSSTIWTWSAWVKRGALTGTYRLFGASTTTYLTFNSSDQLNLTLNGVSAATSTAVFRDPSAWYHIVYQQNGSAQTIYVNNASVATGTTAASIFNTAIAHQIGAANTTNYFDGYLTEVNFIDGQALTPASFGSINSTTGVWQPIKYSGTYGTNGFYLNFNDNSNNTAATIGKDSSGNSNNWTPNGISVTAGVTYDSMLDVPTLTSADNANFATLNPLSGANIGSGNLQVTGSGTGTISDHHFSTIAIPTTGKWYCEMSSTAYNASTIVGWFGVMAINGLGAQSGGRFSGLQSRVTGAGAGFIQDDTIISSANIGALNTVFGLAVDRGANTITIYLNNVAQGTIPTLATGVDLFFVYVTYTSGTGWVNFGQRPFEGTVPTGFKSLNTYNLPAPTIPNGATQFAATTYTGTGSSLAIANTVNGKSFQPDFVWVKGRSGATDHALYDSVRGTTKQLESNTTTAETTEATGLTAFGTGGFTVGALAQMNTNTATYVGWQWKASNAAAVTNTSGSISSQVSANPSAGFSIVTWTVPASGAYTVGHGLGIAPSMIIMKDKTNGTTSWITYHKSISTTTALYLILNSTGGTASSAGIWGSALPTSTVFGNTVAVGTLANDSVVAYCFSEISGYSKFGSYTGNNSATDGTFVYLGFRPRFLIIKSTSASTSWVMVDSSRNTYNLSDTSLYAESANSEATIGTVNDIDFLSNGFKLRNNTGFVNASQTYVYAAFSESPFNYSLAR